MAMVPYAESCWVFLGKFCLFCTARAAGGPVFRRTVEEKEKTKTTRLGVAFLSSCILPWGLPLAGGVLTIAVDQIV